MNHLKFSIMAPAAVLLSQDARFTSPCPTGEAQTCNSEVPRIRKIIHVNYSKINWTYGFENENIL